MCGEGGVHGEEGGSMVRGVCVVRQVWQGACMAGGMYGGGHAWQGVCMAGEMATAADGTSPTGLHSCYV